MINYKYISRNSIIKKLHLLKITYEDVARLTGLSESDVKKCLNERKMTMEIEVITIQNLVDDILQPALDRKSKYLEIINNKTVKKRV